MILQTKIRNFYDACIGLKGETAAIAFCLAIGGVVGVTPTIPLHSAIIIIELLFRQSIAAAYLGSWVISNSVTVPFLYLSQTELGSILLDSAPYDITHADYTLTSITALGWQTFIHLLIGGVIMAPLFTVPAYFISHRLIMVCRAKRRL